MKEFALLIVFLNILDYVISQEISPHLYSINAWMPDTLGNTEDCFGKNNGIPCHLNGKIYKGNIWGQVKQSGARLIRLGGEAADENKPTMQQYIKLIDTVRAYGMEPILQVPYNNNYYTSDTAAAIVEYVNIKMGRNVKYWSIGNEPDLNPPYGYGYISASPIADYIKQFAKKMKAVDSTIFTLGPELKFCNNNHNLINDLTDPGGFYDITGIIPGHTYFYIDIITFHYYPFDGNQLYDQIVKNLREPYQLSQSLDSLNSRVKKCNEFHKRGINPIKAAITETNVNYKNSLDSSKAEVNAHSFFAGQFWADILRIAMEKKLEFVCFWSIVEKSLGYIDDSTYVPRPTYHHFKLMSDYLKGKYSTSTFDIKVDDLKVITSYNEEQIAVMVLNQKKLGKGYQYTLHIGDGKIVSSNGINIRINEASLVKGNVVYSDYIEDESTVLIVFSRYGDIIKKYEYNKKDIRPRIIKNPNIPLLVNLEIIDAIKMNQVVTLSAGTLNNKASYFWYEDNEKRPINRKSSVTLKVLANRNKKIRLITTYEDFKLEELVNLVIEEKIEESID